MDSDQIEQTDSSTENNHNSSSDTQPSQPSQPAQSHSSFASRHSSLNAAKGSGLKKLLKSKKAWAIGGSVSVLIIGVLLLVMFLKIFQLKHMQKLFIEYQFAQIHRQMAKVSTQAVAEAKKNGAKGTSDTVVDQNAPLKQQLQETNADLIDEATKSPEKMTDVAERLKGVDVLVDGERIGKQFGVNRNFKTEEEGKPDEEVKKATDEELSKKVEGSDSPDRAPNDGLDEKAKQAKEEVKAGADPDVALDKAAVGGEKVLSGAAKFDLAIAYSTLFCIAYDIFHTGVEKFAGKKAGAAVRQAEALNTAADAQNEGALSSAQVNALNNRIDNGQESWYDSAAAKRASGLPVDPQLNPDLNDYAMPFALPNGGYIGTVVNFLTGDNVGGAIASNVCPVVLNPQFQVGALVFSVATYVSGGGTLAQLITRGVVQGAAIFGAAKGTEYLIKTAIANYANIGYTNASPAQIGNQKSLGDEIMARESARIKGGRLLTEAEGKDQQTKAVAHLLQSDRQKGLAHRLFNPNNPRSAIAQTLMQVPSSPSTMMASLSRNFAALFNPLKLSQAGGGVALALVQPQTALADDIQCSHVGVPCYGFTDEEINRWTIEENAAYVEPQKAALDAKYGKCFQPGLIRAYVQSGQFDPKRAELKFCNDPSNDELTRYRVYLLQRSTVHNLVLLGNKQPASKGTSGGGNFTPIAGITYPPNMGSANSSGYYQMPDPLNNEYAFYARPAHRCGSKELIGVVYSVALKYKEAYPPSLLLVSDLNASGHASHRNGIDVDLATTDGSAADTSGDPNRSIQLGKWLVDTGIVQLIFYNDPAVISAVNSYAQREVMQYWPNHEDHFHVRISESYAGPTSESC